MVEIEFPSTMIKAQGKMRLGWDALIIILSIYQAMYIPIDISFEPDLFNSPLFVTIDSLINLIFFMDIALRFRTTYIDPISGEEVINSFLIAKRYIKSKNFPLDVLSSIPFDTLVESDSITLKLFGILKL